MQTYLIIVYLVAISFLYLVSYKIKEIAKITKSIFLTFSFLLFIMSLTCALIIAIFKLLDIIVTQQGLLSTLCIVSCVFHIAISGGYRKGDNEHWSDNQIDPSK
jgi:hypothetical protein